MGEFEENNAAAVDALTKPLSCPEPAMPTITEQHKFFKIDSSFWKRDFDESPRQRTICSKQPGVEGFSADHGSTAEDPTESTGW